MGFFSSWVGLGSAALAAVGIWQTAQLLSAIRDEAMPLVPPPLPTPAKPFARGLAATGLLEASGENVAVSPPQAGLVVAVPVRVGQRVGKGELLFELDGREWSAQRVAQEAEVAVRVSGVEVAQARLAKVLDGLQRMESVKDQRAISADDLAARRNEAAVARAELVQAQSLKGAAEAALRQTDLLLERLKVLAPREGTVLQLNLREGEYASPQARLPALVLGDIAVLQARVDVDEQNALDLRPDMAAKAFVKGDSSQPMDLEFVRIEPMMIPKQSLTGASTERVDTRVLQVIYRLRGKVARPLYVGQQIDVFMGDASPLKAKGAQDTK
jgi:HlyD family secretion protein